MKSIFLKSKVLSLCLALMLCFTACAGSSTTPSVTQDEQTYGDTTTSSTEASSGTTEDAGTEDTTSAAEPTVQSTAEYFSVSDIPTYRGDLYVAINDNVPFFSDAELTTVSFEQYSDLDSLGRVGVAVASIGVDIMPTEDRESISSVYPTGWVQETYSTDIVSGGYLYNRSHIIGFQLTGENANTENLMTGTRAFNADAMLLFEDMVADYVKETENHVYYRVTPVFEGDNLLATGVLMEAKSIEDDGDGILFCVFCYNAQDGITIDYATGESWLTGTAVTTPTATPTPTVAAIITGQDTETQTEAIYMLNTNSKKIHLITCHYVNSMSEANKQESSASLDVLISQGYECCKVCLG